MAIQNIRVKNFKSFRELDIDLANLNILVGANASGKSNFVQIFRFLRDISQQGLDNAVSIQGGREYLRNTRIGASEPLSIQVRSKEKWGLLIGRRKRFVSTKVEEVDYRFRLSFHKQGFKVAEDVLEIKTSFKEFEEPPKNLAKEGRHIGTGSFRFFNENGKLGIESELPSQVSENEFYPLSLKGLKLPSCRLLLELPLPTQLLMMNSFSFTQSALFDFDPKLTKKAAPITGRSELEEDGSNLAIVLRNILQSKERKRKFINLLSSILPFVQDAAVQKLADRSLLLLLEEEHTGSLPMPASSLSEGTLEVVLLILALHFDKTHSDAKRLLIFEEPDRNIHSSLISRLIEMFREAAQTKQIIISTHNPELVRQSHLDELLLVSRDKEGYSIITRPGENEQIRIFLENEIGLDDLLVQNLLGA